MWARTWTVGRIAHTTRLAVKLYTLHAFCTERSTSSVKSQAAGTSPTKKKVKAEKAKKKGMKRL